MEQAQRKLVGLEVCRVLCAFSIVVYHYGHFFYDGLAPEKYVASAVPTGLLALFNNGLFAVQVFWVISGYIFFWKYGESIYNRSVSASQFFVWRLSRLYPLHFVTLLVVAFMQVIYFSSHRTYFVYQQNDPQHFALQLFFALNWIGGQGLSFNGPIWSISVELYAYASFFFALRILRPSVLLCLTIILATMSFNEPVTICICYFFAGGLLEQVIGRLPERHHPFAFWAALAVAVEILAGAFWGLPLNYLSVLFLAVAIVATFSLIDAIGLDLSRLAPFGNLTYSSYLIHFPLQLAIVSIVDWLGIGRTAFLSPVVFISYTVTTFILAAAVYHAFEAPAQNAIRSYWSRGGIGRGAAGDGAPLDGGLRRH
jgi:peptidoglycan/LPS O-acetylase OafA/YrhL